MNQDLKQQIGAAVEQQAAAWWLMQRDAAITDAERAGFVEWLRESPLHVRAYFTMAAAGRDLQDAALAWSETAEELVREAVRESDRPANVVPLPGGVAAGVADESPVAQATRWPSAHHARSRRRTFSALAASAIFAVVLAGIWLRDGERFGVPRAYQTAHAEQGSWRLPDGSVLHLNSDSRAVVRFTDTERFVAVDRGQAMFQVAKEPGRRFRVDAGQTQVIAVGTEFDIYRCANQTRVVVLEGRVAVVRGEIAPDAPTLAPSSATALSAGEQLVVASGMRRSDVRPADLRRTRAWLQREIVFDNLPLAQVVEDFNRYTSIPLEVDGEELKSLQISGVFGAYDVDSFLEFLRRLDGVGVAKGPSKIRIYLLREPAWAEPIVDLHENPTTELARSATAEH